MKTGVYFFLFLFIAFLATPLVVNIFKSDTDRVVVAVVEEEDTKSFKLELKRNLQNDKDFINGFAPTLLKKNKICDKNYLIAYAIYLDPVSPPPRLV